MKTMVDWLYVLVAFLAIGAMICINLDPSGANQDLTRDSDDNTTTQR